MERRTLVDGDNGEVVVFDAQPRPAFAASHVCAFHRGAAPPRSAPLAAVGAPGAAALGPRPVGDPGRAMLLIGPPSVGRSPRADPPPQPRAASGIGIRRQPVDPLSARPR